VRGKDIENLIKHDILLTYPYISISEQKHTKSEHIEELQHYKKEYLEFMESIKKSFLTHKKRRKVKESQRNIHIR